MGDRITTFSDCPKCGGKETFECYEALSSNLKLDECTECGYTVRYTFEEKDGVTEIQKVKPKTESMPEEDMDKLGSVGGNDAIDEIIYRIYRAGSDGASFEFAKPAILSQLQKAVIEAEMDLLFDMCTDLYELAEVDKVKSGDIWTIHKHYLDRWGKLKSQLKDMEGR